MQTLIKQIREHLNITQSDFAKLSKAYECIFCGISLANDICKNYRREGLFFDEIIDNAEMETE